MNVDVFEGDLSHEFESHHDHARDPEEQDIETCDQRRCGVIGLEFLCVIGPSQG